MGKKGQAANETALIMGFMTLFLIAFLAVISDKLFIATDDRAKEIAEDLADVIESELVLAANSQDGYSRIFTLPFSLDGKPYRLSFYNASNTEANFTHMEVGINVTGGEYTAFRVLPKNIQGTLGVGDNFARKHEGFVNVSAPLS
ncbi:hypothetical protein J4470_02890 [Candidatus Woesearchaeota archaeon]|nr:hypothetical protein [Candidatus Woesearchaeota archaeon]